MAKKVESVGSPRPVSKGGMSGNMRALESSTPARDEDSEKGSGEFMNMLNVKGAYIPVVNNLAFTLNKQYNCSGSLDNL